MSDEYPDNDELRTAVRAMLSAASSSEQVRALIPTASGIDEKLRAQYAGMGLTGIEVAESAGGAGAPFSTLAVVLVELGRCLADSGLTASAVLAAAALEGRGESALAQRWLPRLAGGESRATVAMLDGSGSLDQVPFTATRDNGNWRVTGQAALVADATTADLIVLPARDVDGGDIVVAVEMPRAGLSLQSAPMLDMTRRFADLSCDLQVEPSALLAAGDDATRLIDRLRDRAALAAACDGLGIAEKALELTVEYAKVRIQFDRPIGSFQAVKHRCSDMYIAVETARIALDEALLHFDTSPGDASAAVSRAKAYCCDAAALVTEGAVKMHGGIGYTWEHDMHLYLKRARLDQALYGDSRWHRRRVADLVLG